jgi:hypothetical protein
VHFHAGNTESAENCNGDGNSHGNDNRNCNDNCRRRMLSIRRIISDRSARLESASLEDLCKSFEGGVARRTLAPNPLKAFFKALC